MKFRTENPSDLVVGSQWVYVEHTTPYQRQGVSIYQIEDFPENIPRSAGRVNIREVGGRYDHNLTPHQILDWFIPFDSQVRPHIVNISKILTSMRDHGVPAQELHDLLVKLEI